uniref:Translation initiation factor eIF2 assembly protein n=1 Tax=Lates calcarifer TaxID=8187 RepID=A0A4W6F791_LATCA
MKKEQVVNCQFSVWYPIFKKYTIKSLILPLPQNVIDYLLDDGTLVVSGSDHNTQQTHTNNSDSDAEEDIQWSDDETTSTVTAPEFPEFTSKVLEAINALGGRVFPKLNWSAPRDANWIALNSSLQCHSLSDIFLLFKSSDFITHDLTQPFLHCSDQDSPDPVFNYEVFLSFMLKSIGLICVAVAVMLIVYIILSIHTHTLWILTCVIFCPQLVLRKWSELIPGGEFRCFVKENKLIAISQRDYTQYYHHILKQEEQICQAIQEFFSQHIQYKFLDEDFVFDVYRDSQVSILMNSDLVSFQICPLQIVLHSLCCVCFAGQSVADRLEPIRRGDRLTAVQLGGADVWWRNRPPTGGPGVPLHKQRGDGAAQSLSELQDPTGLCGPLHRRRRLQTH